MSQTIIGFDYGQRKIGVAIGNTSTGLAQGITTISTHSSTGPWRAIEKLIEDWHPTSLVVGFPYSWHGGKTDSSGLIREFGRELAHRFKLPVNFIAETLTTDFADFLIRETTMPGKRITKRRKLVRDQLAAELILKTYLNEHTDPKTE